MSGETGIRDLVTGLYTRDYFDEVIGRELERARRHGIDLSVLSAVVVNRPELVERDAFLADQVLASAGKHIQINVRETDYVFRWEDDEFLVLLFEADAIACARKVTQLNSVFRPWREGKGPYRVPVRIRFGGATHDRDIVFAGVLQAARAIARQVTRY